LVLEAELPPSDEPLASGLDVEAASAGFFDDSPPVLAGLPRESVR
jgi:hypothetical protein